MPFICVAVGCVEVSVGACSNVGLVRTSIVAVSVKDGAVVVQVADALAALAQGEGGEDSPKGQRRPVSLVHGRLLMSSRTVPVATGACCRYHNES